MWRAVDAALEYDPTPWPAFQPADGDRAADSDRRYAKLEAAYTGSDRWRPTVTVTTARAADVQFADGARSASTLGERVTATLSSNFALSDAHFLNATAERETHRFRQRGAPTPFGDPNQSQRLTARGAAVEYQYRGMRTFGSLSARFDRHDAFDDAFAWMVSAGRLKAGVARGSDTRGDDSFDEPPPG